jgi:catechol 2,3-dioxygenase-like lactoylglutathione lyase family enzyme
MSTNWHKAPMIMTRVILYVRDVELLKSFYQSHFDVPVVEEITGEWAVLKAGAIELALHLVGPEYRDDAPNAVDEVAHGAPADSAGSNVKLVFTVRSHLPVLRERLLATGVKMGNLKRFAGFAMLTCDGVDPEGNVFQLSQPD